MALSFNIKTKIYKNNKVWKQIVRNLKRGGQYKANIGFFEGLYPSGISIPQIAAWNEEGHHTGWGGYSPPRPFIRLGTMREVGNQTWHRKWHRYIHLIAMGRMTWRQLNVLVAKDVEKIMKEQILKWSSPPNKPSTISIKGFNDPLIDTGRMYDKVGYKIVRSGR